MKLKLFLVIGILFTAFTAWSQKLIIEEYPDKIFEPPAFGIKGKNYLHLLVETSTPFGASESDTLKTRNWRTGCWNFGIRYKRKFTKKFFYVAELTYNLQSWVVRQDKNRFPDTIAHRKEKFNLNQICGAMGLRYIYSKRKKYFGNYIDGGGSFAWNFSTAHYVKNIDKYSGLAYNKTVVKLKEKNPQYLFPYAIDAWVGFGFELTQFRIYYRITDFFQSYGGAKASEFPSVRAGVNIALTGGN
jgi:hypothetical protein